MNVAFVVEEHPDRSRVTSSPWIFHQKQLAEADITVELFDDLKKAWRPFDAMILMVWLDWDNPIHFKADRIVPVMEKYSAYRAAFPETIQIVLNHTDMNRHAYAAPYWRIGDPVLFRTPAYDRIELAPFPPNRIFAYEYLEGQALPPSPIKYAAGFIGTPSGPPGYRNRVAAETAKVGLGKCLRVPIPAEKYDALLASCRIMVCPRGWGENSGRHWDAWRSGKAVLTDRECDSVEMIPGIRLRDGVHYLVYDDPREIPDLVNDWSRPGRRDDLDEIASNGRKAALSYNPYQRMVEFFGALVNGSWSSPE
ncbi:MAG TPA: glycosyltransferase [Candidatus Binataceae bacterium]|nr:glycosyltransferase [Candidatus Binataceae bacterium]